MRIKLEDYEHKIGNIATRGNRFNRIRTRTSILSLPTRQDESRPIIKTSIPLTFVCDRNSIDYIDTVLTAVLLCEIKRRTTKSTSIVCSYHNKNNNKNNK